MPLSDLRGFVWGPTILAGVLMWEVSEDAGLPNTMHGPQALFDTQTTASKTYSNHWERSPPPTRCLACPPVLWQGRAPSETTATCPGALRADLLLTPPPTKIWGPPPHSPCLGCNPAGMPVCAPLRGSFPLPTQWVKLHLPETRTKNASLQGPLYTPPPKLTYAAGAKFRVCGPPALCISFLDPQSLSTSATGPCRLATPKSTESWLGPARRTQHLELKP